MGCLYQFIQPIVNGIAWLTQLVSDMPLWVDSFFLYSWMPQI